MLRITWCLLWVPLMAMTGNCLAYGEPPNLFDPQVSLTMNPVTRNLQIYWSNRNMERGDRILITDVDPGVDKFQKFEATVTTVPPPTTTTEGDLFTSLYSLDKFLGLSTDTADGFEEEANTPEPPKYVWRFGSPSRDVLYSMQVQEPSGWWRTNVPFDLNLLHGLTSNTSCYGYWVHMIDVNGTVLTKNCWRAHPRWMNEMREQIKDVKIRNLFIPGSHDSGSHKRPAIETLVTKYTVTQDDDIRSQLLHGIRYLDIRVGHYRQSEHGFYVVHGYAKFQPLIEVLEAVKDFVEETNEIVILDFQEFPVGFNKNASQMHRKLVQFIYNHMKDHLIEPYGTWDVTMGDLWEKRGNVVIGYDKPTTQIEFREILWQSVEHFWPNKQDVQSLVQYLKRTRNSTSMNYRMRPIAEMVELTPKTMDVVTDRYGGLRKMAQTTNKVISDLYSTEFGLEANVVAVDFYMSSTIVETALKFNRLKGKPVKESRGALEESDG